MESKERRTEGRLVESAEERPVSRDLKALVHDFAFACIHEKKVRSIAMSEMVGGGQVENLKVRMFGGDK